MIRIFKVGSGGMTSRHTNTKTQYTCITDAGLLDCSQNSLSDLPAKRQR